jgi:hypothetical protein
LHPLLDEGDARALALAHAGDAALSHIAHGSAIVEESGSAILREVLAA